MLPLQTQRNATQNQTMNPPSQAQSKPAKERPSTKSRSPYAYTAVLDGRKQPIPHLKIRNGKYLARLTVADESGRKKECYFPLTATTTAEAKEALRKLLVERDENRLRHARRSPTFSEYLKTYMGNLATSGKKADTLITERTHYNRWNEAIGGAVGPNPPAPHKRASWHPRAQGSFRSHAQPFAGVPAVGAQSCQG